MCKNLYEKLIKKASAIIMTPGGIGTYDEFFEVLTLKQLGRHNKPIVIYNINNYLFTRQYFVNNCLNSFKFIFIIFNYYRRHTDSR